MILLLFSDLHDDVAAAEAVVEQSRDVDVLIGAGDFCNAHQHVSRTLDILAAARKPMVLVAGNNETTEELRDACAGRNDFVVLHGTGMSIAGMSFYGVGGAIPITPFGAWSYDFDERRAAELLKDCPSGGVLVTHSPPFGVVDVASRGKHLGSTSIRAAVDRCLPRLVVCGHIHGSAGRTELLGETPVVNAGPRGVIRVVTV